MTNMRYGNKQEKLFENLSIKTKKFTILYPLNNIYFVLSIILKHLAV